MAIDNDAIYVFSSPFNYASGGTFSYSGLSQPVPMFTSLLIINDPADMLWLSEDPRHDACDSNDTEFSPASSPRTSSAGFLNGTVTEGRSRTIWFGPCEEGRIIYTFSAWLRIPDTFLGLDEYSLLFGTPVLTTVVGLIVAVRLVNWLCLSSLENKQHMLFTAAAGPASAAPVSSHGGRATLGNVTLGSGPGLPVAASTVAKLRADSRYVWCYWMLC